MMTIDALRNLRVFLVICVLGVFSAIALLGYYIATPYVDSAKGEIQASQLQIPAYDLSDWHRAVVQMNGRKMPFETTAINALRQVTGRSKFEGYDAVAIVLSWMLTKGGTAGLPSQLTNWEEYPFILCDDPRLRGPILTDALKPDVPTEEQLHGKYLSPKQVRNSKALHELLLAARGEQNKDPERGNQSFSPEMKKAQELNEQLRVYDALTQGDPMTNGQRHQKPESPIHLVALDRVANSPWLSLPDLVSCLGAKDAWRQLLDERMKATPHLYLAPQRQEALKQFQEQVLAGTEGPALKELEKQLKQQREQVLAKISVALEANKPEEAMRIFDTELVKSKDQEESLKRFAGRFNREDLLKPETLALLSREAANKLADADTAKIEMLEQEAKRARKVGYVPDKDQFRTLHMTYLELLFPNLYEESLSWQPFPEAKARKVLADWIDLQQAYASQNSQTFSDASKRFLSTLATVSQDVEKSYPSCDTLDLELQFNRIEPFKWAWVSMLLAVFCFAVSLGFVNNAVYYLGFLFFLGSLGFQAFGFYSRISISGRPPVTNMYETVIFVACMASLFAFVLELVYRPKYIVLAGSIVATLGLVLADQLPVSRGFDSAIQPLTPVLRSNFWLIIHVLTIVSSYAAGALAWSMGNIVLFMYYFRNPKAEELKQLSKLTYRSMQIAVLLLAAGTFLGGWWAAYSWGRFWGWDPKETWALIALIAYVIPLHMRYIGWVKDFGLAVSAVVCFAAIVMSWYGVNFILGAGLHSYGFGGGGPYFVYLACLLNLGWVCIVGLKYVSRQLAVIEAPAS